MDYRYANMNETQMQCLLDYIDKTIDYVLAASQKEYSFKEREKLNEARKELRKAFNLRQPLIEQNDPS